MRKIKKKKLLDSFFLVYGQDMPVMTEVRRAIQIRHTMPLNHPWPIHTHTHTHTHSHIYSPASEYTWDQTRRQRLFCIRSAQTTSPLAHSLQPCNKRVSDTTMHTHTPQTTPTTRHREQLAAKLKYSTSYWWQSLLYNTRNTNPDYYSLYYRE